MHTHARPGDLGKHDEERAMPTKLPCLPASSSDALRQRLLFAGQVTLFIIVVVQFVMMYKHFAVAAACGSMVEAGMMRRQSASSSSTSSLPDYYQTVPEL